MYLFSITAPFLANLKELLTTCCDISRAHSHSERFWLRYGYQVVEGIRAFLPTGLNLPILWEIIGPNRQRSLRLTAKEVMPKLLQ